MNTADVATDSGNATWPAWLSSGRRRAVLARLVLTAILAPPAGFYAVMIFGGGLQIAGMLMVVPPLYLTAMWFLDAGSLLRNLRSPTEHRSQPGYLWWLLFCVAVLLFWIAWAIYTLPLATTH